MPTSPDFDQIARDLFRPLRLGNARHDVRITWEFVDELQSRTFQQLRLVWNARGAADLAKIDATVTYTYGSADAPIVKTLTRALRTLDR